MKDSYKEIEQPNSLEDCYRILNDILTDREVFKTTLEENAMAMAHHGLGTFLRNNWYLWWDESWKEDEDKGLPQEMPAIVKYFNETWGIKHADDMSGIILQSYHRHLNGKELGIEEQVKKYKAHWAKHGL